MSKELKNRKNEIIILIFIVVFIIVGAILGSSFAFFNYTRTGDINALVEGTIKFSFTDSDSISLGNINPVSQSDIDNKISRDFTISGHTTYAKGIEYKVYAVLGDEVSGKTRLVDNVISVEFTPPVDGDGFETKVNNHSSPASLTFKNGKALISSGIIKDTTELTTKSYNVKLWVDSDKINVSSTTKRATNAEGNPSLADASDGMIMVDRYIKNDNNLVSTQLYPAEENQQGKIIYTTKEFSNSYYSIKIVVEANEVRALCKRATNLHTETCSRTYGNYYCRGDGYYAEGSKRTSTITYGSIWDGESTLKAGDAFDCDVNGNGYFDADANGNSTERFYYVSPYFNTDTKTFDDATTGYATLIYYRNYKNGSPSDEGLAYHPSDNWHGPTLPINSLPSTTGTGAWRDDLLKTTDRKILSCNNVSCTTLSGTTSNGGKRITYNTPIYNGKAARLLTLKELVRGCNLTGTGTSGSTGQLSNCNFIFERTKYATDNSSLTAGPWLENPKSTHDDMGWHATSLYRYAEMEYYYQTDNGVRPVIDIPVSQLEY